MDLLGAVFVVLAGVTAVLAIVRFRHMREKAEADQRRERYLFASLLLAAGVAVTPYVISSDAIAEYIQAGLAIVALGLLMVVGRREFESRRWRREIPFGP